MVMNFEYENKCTKLSDIRNENDSSSLNLIKSENTHARGLRDGNPCLKDQLEDLKHVGKMTFWKIRIKNMNVRNWKKVVQNRDSWKKVDEKDRTLCRL
jgi:hypothetical protein